MTALPQSATISRRLALKYTALKYTLNFINGLTALVQWKSASSTFFRYADGAVAQDALHLSELVDAAHARDRDPWCSLINLFQGVFGMITT